MISRRFVLSGLIAAPAIVKVSSLMPVKLIDWHAPITRGWWNNYFEKPIFLHFSEYRGVPIRVVDVLIGTDNA
jgi:hypothetical protein